MLLPELLKWRARLRCDPSDRVFIEDDEVVAVASERAPLMTVFDKKIEEVSEIEPGLIVVIRSNEVVTNDLPRTRKKNSLSVERIYFSRK